MKAKAFINSTGGVTERRMAVYVSEELMRANGRNAGDEDQFVTRWQLHDFAGGEERTRGLLARDHEMAEPGREPMSGIVLHGTQLCRHAERVGHIADAGFEVDVDAAGTRLIGRSVFAGAAVQFVGVRTTVEHVIFNEIPYFNRCFRRRFGESPTGLRADGSARNRSL
jgi:AraC-like DNA-binding protein